MGWKELANSVANAFGPATAEENAAKAARRKKAEDAAEASVKVPRDEQGIGMVQPKNKPTPGASIKKSLGGE